MTALTQLLYCIHRPKAGMKNPNHTDNTPWQLDKTYRNITQYLDPVHMTKNTEATHEQVSYVFTHCLGVLGTVIITGSNSSRQGVPHLYPLDGHHQV